MAKPGHAVGNQFWLQVVKRLGVPQQHRRNAVRFLRAQQSGERTLATWNPLATTRRAPGSTDFNSVPVQNFPSRRAGIQATVQTYLNGHYDGIVSDLRRGVPARKIATGRLDELKTWGTGELVAQRLGSTPLPVLPTGSRTPRRGPRAPAAPAAPGAQANTTARKLLALQLLQMASAPEIDFEAMLPLLTQASQMMSAPSPAAPAPRGRTGGRTRPAAPSGTRQMYTGDGLQLPASFRSTHPTSGLAGYPAIDLLRPAGTPVYAPVSGTITDLSGHPDVRGSTFGRSIYLSGSRKKFFLTHFDWGRTIVKVGQKVRKGELIGYVGDWPGGSSHIHIGVNG